MSQTNAMQKAFCTRCLLLNNSKYPSTQSPLEAYRPIVVRLASKTRHAKAVKAPR